MKKSGTFNEHWFRWTGIPVLTFLLVLIIKKPVHCTMSQFWFDYAITLIFTFCIWNSNYYIVKYFRKKHPSLNETPTRILRTFVLTMLNTIVVCITLDYILFLIFRVTGSYALNGTNLLTGIVASSFVLSVYEGLYFFEKWKDAMLSAEELKKANLQIQFDSLKNQVNPHFLFNSLNTLSSLVEEDSKSAVSFIQKMSNVYRYILQSNDTSLTTVKKELEFIESFVFMLKTRFDKNFHVIINIEEEYHNYFIPPHTLQMLVENAVKHNEVSDEYPLTVTLFTEEDYLVVSNRIQRKSSLVKSNGVGLQNIMQRYELLSDKRVLISEENNTFIVKVPLLHNA